jgi:hypothetical protein
MRIAGPNSPDLLFFSFPSFAALVAERAEADAMLRQVTELQAEAVASAVYT